MKDNSIQPKSSFKETKKRSSLKNNSNILDPHKISQQQQKKQKKKRKKMKILKKKKKKLVKIKKK